MLFASPMDLDPGVFLGPSLDTFLNNTFPEFSAHPFCQGGGDGAGQCSYAKVRTSPPIYHPVLLY